LGFEEWHVEVGIVASYDMDELVCYQTISAR
jgi:hypothetical protein